MQCKECVCHTLERPLQLDGWKSVKGVTETIQPRVLPAETHYQLNLNCRTAVQSAILHTLLVLKLQHEYSFNNSVGKQAYVWMSKCICLRHQRRLWLHRPNPMNIQWEITDSSRSRDVNICLFFTRRWICGTDIIGLLRTWGCHICF